MRLSSVLLQQKKTYSSLALSVYFKHPDLKMKDYEILSRASAFLLGVDPPESEGKGAFVDLEKAEKRRKLRSLKRSTGYSPASPGGDVSQMGWLEFAPREYRPNVHVVASSHVVSPYLWKEYYPQEWLDLVKNEHCRYALEVFDEPGKPVAKFALEAEPYHHPEGRDVALMHFKDEGGTLPLLTKLGVDIMHLRGKDSPYEKGDNLTFDGYAVTEADKDIPPEEIEEDNRVFYPLKQAGSLAFHTNDRFFATTDIPLPEGMCGAPAVDDDGRCCGVVEGIVPVDHENKELAGSAAFMPSYILGSFVEYVERKMLRELMPNDLFNMCVTAKKTNTIGGGVYKLDDEGKSIGPGDWQEACGEVRERMKGRLSKEEYEAWIAVMEEEEKQITEILAKEGGDLHEIMERVRARTLAIRDMVHKEYRKAHDMRSDSEGDEMQVPPAQ